MMEYMIANNSWSSSLTIVKPWNFFKILFVFYLDYREAVYFFFIDK